MVSLSQVVLASENFKENAVLNLKQMWRSREFTDVTLVSSEGLKLHAHKSVLSSTSAFFRDILIGNEHPSVLLYMRGVAHEELELLLEFTYTGECQVEAAKLESFLATGKDLGLQVLLENTIVSELPRMSPVNENSKMFGDTIEETGITAHLKPGSGAGHPINISHNPIFHKETSMFSNLKSGSDGGLSINIAHNIDMPSDKNTELDSKMAYDASEETLQKELKSDFDQRPMIPDMNMELSLDKNSEHVAMLDVGGSPTRTGKKEDVGWTCVHCSKSVFSEQILKAHISNKHGPLVMCKTCSFKTSSLALLGKHHKSVHGGYIRKCDQCPFQTTRGYYLKTHKEIKHDGLKYQCDQCSNCYTEKRKLYKHMKSIHEGVTYHCEYCDHEAKTELTIKKHISSMQKYNDEAHMPPV